MASEKTVNYTAEQTAEMVNSYLAGETVEALAARLGRTVRSVVAKLSAEKVYESKAKSASKTRKVTKAQMAEALAKAAGVEVKVFESLEKASVEALEALVAAFVETEAE